MGVSLAALAADLASSTFSGGAAGDGGAMAGLFAGVDATVGASVGAFVPAASPARATPTDPSHAKTSAEQTVDIRIRVSPANLSRNNAFEKWKCGSRAPMEADAAPQASFAAFLRGNP